ncbi:nicotinate phosphoribosyltransferase [Gordonia terrae]|uniref:Nicotinamide phosphoribosyltransferase n=1 Tax=Gordonia terrae TaxID=2055 RepID=A0A2I1R4T2_9ACTN|nr:nicotinate phosphoribosyltransferase [Gordonia terrae]PKZ64137.1 nicotinate phosphoribosyltransferase [Gordonia terrae]
MRAQSPNWRNMIVNVDSYKNTHHSMYPAGTEYVSSYIESRGGAYPASLFVGLQAFLREYLMHPLTVEDVHEAENVHRAMNVPFNRNIWIDLINDHNGFLPIAIEAVPEGSVVPTRNVLVQVINTDPRYPWLPSFIETALLRAVWYPTSVATISWNIKQNLRELFERTSDFPQLLRGYLHDYGARGVSSHESAAIGGLAHLVNFDQSDTVPGYIAARQWYNASAPNGTSAFQEHTNTIAFGPENEANTFRALLANTTVGVAGLLCDTYDHENAVRNIVGKELHDEVASFPGLVVIRCDSGDPVQVPADTIEWLMEDFGSTDNSKGFRQLPPNIRVVQGDGLTPASHAALYAELEHRGIAADNLICGMGGGLLQRVNRDTLNFGMKASAICVSGSWRGIQKSPKGDPMKRSKAGRLALIHVDGDYKTVARETIPADENVLVPVFRNGKLLRMWDFEELKARSEQPVPQSYYRTDETTLSR